MQYQGGRCGAASPQIVKHGGGFFKEQRQIIFNARSGHAVANVFVNTAFGGIAIQQFTPPTAKLGTRRFVHGKFSARQQTNFGHGVQTALRVGIESPDRVNLVVKQVDAVGHLRAHGKQINQAAAHRIFTGTDHLAHMAVACQGQLGFELGFVQLLLGLELKGVARQK